LIGVTVHHVVGREAVAHHVEWTPDKRENQTQHAEGDERGGEPNSDNFRSVVHDSFSNLSFDWQQPTEKLCRSDEEEMCLQ
jgi:hypothetical protein